MSSGAPCENHDDREAPGGWLVGEIIIDYSRFPNYLIRAHSFWSTIIYIWLQFRIQCREGAGGGYVEAK